MALRAVLELVGHEGSLHHSLEIHQIFELVVQVRSLGSDGFLEFGLFNVLHVESSFYVVEGGSDGRGEDTG